MYEIVAHAIGVVAVQADEAERSGLPVTLEVVGEPVPLLAEARLLLSDEAELPRTPPARSRGRNPNRARLELDPGMTAPMPDDSGLGCSVVLVMLVADASHFGEVWGSKVRAPRRAEFAKTCQARARPPCAAISFTS